jgi:hypothetical protein
MPRATKMTRKNETFTNREVEGKSIQERMMVSVEPGVDDQSIPQTGLEQVQPTEKQDSQERICRSLSVLHLLS